MNSSKEQSIRLTQYSHGAGCGCKISPKDLTRILASSRKHPATANLLVGNDTRDDAAVVDLGDGTGIISTTDFFMPIVDDAFTFGQIAATNAISDIYAMGGTPLVAIAILGWPTNKISLEIANLVVEGGRDTCQRAGITLAGGHSIDSPEPIFGLAVTGRVPIKNLKRNNGGRPDDSLFLTKPLGVGILSTAEKRGTLEPAHTHLAKESMLRLNHLGAQLGELSYVHAMTDVTGFGLLGHLSEMCDGAKASAILHADAVPLIEKASLINYVEAGCVPGGSKRNWESYGHRVECEDELTQTLFCDPQTSGGLLVAVDPKMLDAFQAKTQKEGFALQAIGALRSGDGTIVVDGSVS